MQIVERVSAWREFCVPLAKHVREVAPELLGRATALEIELDTLAAMCARKTNARSNSRMSALPAQALLLKAHTVEGQLRELTLDVAGHGALPAPDPVRAHNQPPLADPLDAGAFQAWVEWASDDAAYRLRDELVRQLFHVGDAT